MGIIYRIFCKETNKSYIGKTIQYLKKRVKQHNQSRSYCRYLSKAIKDHGWDNFEVSVLWEGSNYLLGDMEKKYISEYVTLYPYGYNMRGGGGKSEKVCDVSKSLMIEKQREISKRRSGLLGVLIPNGHGKVTSWSLSVPRNGTRYRLGPFKTKEEAIKIQEKYTSDPDNFELPKSKRVGNGKGTGIYYRKDRDKWQVLPNINGKNIYLGLYRTEEEAYKVLTNFRENDTILD